MQGRGWQGCPRYSGDFWPTRSIALASVLPCCGRNGFLRAKTLLLPGMEGTPDQPLVRRMLLRGQDDPRQRSISILSRLAAGGGCGTVTCFMKVKSPSRFFCSSHSFPLFTTGTETPLITGSPTTSIQRNIKSHVNENSFRSRPRCETTEGRQAFLTRNRKQTICCIRRNSSARPGSRTGTGEVEKKRQCSGLVIESRIFDISADSGTKKRPRWGDPGL